MITNAQRPVGILLVEDADDDAFFTTRAINAISHLKLIDRARSGREVIASIRGGLLPGLVILDLQMPDGDGFEVLKVFRTLPNRPKVLVLSNRGDMDSVQDAFGLGADAYHAKTQDPSQLARILNSLGWLPRTG